MGARDSKQGVIRVLFRPEGSTAGHRAVEGTSTARNLSMVLREVNMVIY